MVKNPQFEINLRQNTNSLSAAFGKYYPKAKEKQTISLRGLCDHMAGHNCIYGRDVIEGVLTKMSSCIVELLSQGNPVKIDGLGIFVPKVQATKNGISLNDLLAGKWNASTYVKGIHIRFRPEGSGDEDITSRRFKEQCSLSTFGVEEKIDLTPDETDPDKKQFIKRITPLDDWILQHLQSTDATPSGSGSDNTGSNSGSNTGSNSGTDNSGSGSTNSGNSGDSGSGNSGSGNGDGPSGLGG